MRNRMVTNVLEYLEESAEKYPDKIFLADEKRSVTFAEAQDVAKRIGSYLLNQVHERNKPIVVFIGRDVESVLMFLGVAYSGNFYVPINPELPEKRLHVMLESIRPEAVLVASKEKYEDRVFDVPLHEYIKMSSVEIDTTELEKIRKLSIDTDPLCGIFTSGSTGTPKCVLKSHRSIIFMAEQFSHIFQLNNHDVFANQVSFDFDVSNKDIYTSLRNGSIVHIIPKKLYMFPSELVKYINDKCVSILFWATSALHVVYRLHAFKHEKLNCVRKVMYSGESISSNILKYWMENMPKTDFYNLYGPTEMTGNCTYYKVQKDFQENQVPIGGILPGGRVFLLDEDKKLIKGNEIGEVYIGGGALATGYYNDPEKTKMRFIQNPLNPHYPEIVYRTGDLARYDENGQLIFCGRKDYQIKHMGYRIELGDIEAAADGVERIGRSCCLYDRERDRIVLFYEAREDLKKELREFLKEKLPPYMIPGKYVQMERFPENYHGKIDRKQLEEEYLAN